MDEHEKRRTLAATARLMRDIAVVGRWNNVVSLFTAVATGITALSIYSISTSKEYPSEDDDTTKTKKK
jgi:hypothetical protein